jgi:predicted Rossmann fold flavoprotein
MAAITAGQQAKVNAKAEGLPLRIVIFDGAPRLGAKILAAGGGRCNVTHFEVDENDFSGASRNAIRKVLLRFTADDTVRFFADLGVELKREETGKLFPVTDKARTVLEALLKAAVDAGVTLAVSHRVESIESAKNEPCAFTLRGPFGETRASRIILATGGKSLPTTGSDGHGYKLAQSLGHSLTPRVFPALVPLVLADGHFVRALSGVTVPTALEVRAASGKRLAAFADSTLCTHFGLSGPAALNISRHLTAARDAEPAAGLWVHWLPSVTAETLDADLQKLDQGSPLGYLRERMPERLALALCEAAGIDPRLPGHRLSRHDRRALVRAVTDCPLPVTGDKGYNVAEVTAGGVPLTEIHLKTMESRLCPGLYLCGEICDVDGRIGGFNFQWAWASGFVAGGAAAMVIES